MSAWTNNGQAVASARAHFFPTGRAAASGWRPAASTTTAAATAQRRGFWRIQRPVDQRALFAAEKCHYRRTKQRAKYMARPRAAVAERLERSPV